MIQKSDSIKNIAVALRKAQEEIKAVEMDAVNPFLGNKYASLGAIIEASKSILSKNGLSVSQLVESNPNEIGVTTILLHDTGEYLSSTALIPIQDAKGLSLAQSAGAIITYMRRYCLAAILGMYADEDTDGTKVQKRIDNPKKSPLGDPKAVMTIESANTVKNSEGVEYGKIPSDKLTFMANSIQKTMDAGNDPKKEEHQYKLDAIKTILKWRAAKG